MKKYVLKLASILMAILTLVSFTGTTVFAASEPTLAFEGKYDSDKNTYTVTASIKNSAIDVGAAMFVLDYNQALLQTSSTSVSYLNGAIQSATYHNESKGYIGADWYYQPALSKNNNSVQVVKIVFTLKGNYSDLNRDSIKICADTQYLDDIAGYGVDGGALICSGMDYYNIAGNSINLVFNLDLPEEATTTTTNNTTTTNTTTTNNTSATNNTSTTQTTTTTASEPSQSDVKVTRLAGADRIATAISISEEGWKKAKNVVLANALSYPDALAGAPLAYKLDAPILLTAGKDSLERAILDELNRLGAKNIYILGGDAAVSEKISKALSNSGYTVKRLSGESRYETAVAIARQLDELTIAKPSELFFVSGANFPDALAVSSVAALKGCPILYISADGAIDKATAEYVTASKCKKATILGGTAAVSNVGMNSISKLGVTVSRISGANRYETALAIYNEYDKVFKGKGVAIATGNNYPDALAGGVFAAKNKMPVVLVPQKLSANDSIVKYVDSKDISTIYVFGGSNAVPAEVVEQLAN